MKKSWIRSVALCTAVGLSSVALAAEPTAKVHLGLNHADGLIKDLEFMTVKLAKQQTTFEKNIKPNIEIFLIGVNPLLPVGISVLLEAEKGQRRLTQIPVANLKDDFIKGNLDPIGITVDRDRKDKTLYQLSGDVFEGFMRAEGDDKYASISTLKDDVPVGTTTPDVTLNALFAKGYDAAVYSLSTEAEAKIREGAFKKLKDNTVESLTKKTDETQEAFDLRKLIIIQQIDRIGQLFSQTLLLEAGWATDEAKEMGWGQSHWTALPNTEFAKWITKLETETSHFASIPVNEKSVFTARVLLPTTEASLANFREVYKLSPTVIKQKIEAKADLSADEKAARSGAVDAGMDALLKSLDTGVLDLFVDVAPSNDKLHTFVLGTRSVDNRAQIETLVGHLGKVKAGWSSKQNIETIGETKFHSFTVTNPPKALVDFYGSDGTVYVAAGPAFVGFATGEGSLDVLKKLAETATTGEKKIPESFVDVRFHAQKSLETTNAFLQEEDFDMLHLLQNSGLQLSKKNKGNDKEANKKDSGSGKAADKLNALKSFEWQKTAIDAMEGTDDLVAMKFKLVSGAIDGESKAEKGVLTGVGAVIAKFAKENLGGGN